jgi:hypothetical protein
MSIDLMPGFGAFTAGGATLPTFPAPSAVQEVVSPNWTGSGTITTGQGDPLGGTAAVLIAANTTGTVNGSDPGLSGAAGGVVGSYVSSNTYTVSFYAKHVAGSGWIRVGIYDTGSGDAGCYFNASTGAIGDYRSGGTTESNAGVIDVGNGWYQFYFSYPMTTTSVPASHQIGPRGASDSNFDASSSVTSGDGFYVFRYQIVNGTNPNG